MTWNPGNFEGFSRQLGPLLHKCERESWMYAPNLCVDFLTPRSSTHTRKV